MNLIKTNKFSASQPTPTRRKKYITAPALKNVPPSPEIHVFTFKKKAVLVEQGIVISQPKACHMLYAPRFNPPKLTQLLNLVAQFCLRPKFKIHATINQEQTAVRLSSLGDDKRKIKRLFNRLTQASRQVNQLRG